MHYCYSVLICLCLETCLYSLYSLATVHDAVKFGALVAIFGTTESGGVKVTPHVYVAAPELVIEYDDVEVS